MSRRGSIDGIITITQEDRIRVVDAAGRGYLFVVGRRVRRSLPELWALARDRQPVTIVYEGAPDLGAVANDVRVRETGTATHEQRAPVGVTPQ
jgi:hypothetical protein